MQWVASATRSPACILLSLSAPNLLRITSVVQSSASEQAARRKAPVPCMPAIRSFGIGRSQPDNIKHRCVSRFSDHPPFRSQTAIPRRPIFRAAAGALSGEHVVTQRYLPGRSSQKTAQADPTDASNPGARVGQPVQSHLQTQRPDEGLRSVGGAALSRQRGRVRH